MRGFMNLKYTRTFKTGILSNNILLYFIVRLNDTKDVCYCGSSAFNYINTVCMSDRFK